MKQIYISLPITGQEDTYERRLQEAIDWCKKNMKGTYRITTPKTIQEFVEKHTEKPKYSDYLCTDLKFIEDYADVVVFSKGWRESRGCRIEYVFAIEFHKEIIMQ